MGTRRTAAIRAATTLLLLTPCGLLGCGAADDASAATVRPVAARPAPRTGHAMNIAGMETPSRAISGRIGGLPFTLEDVAWHDGSTTVVLESAEGHTVFLFLFLDEGATLAGTTRVFEQASDGFGQPHVHVHFPPDDPHDVLMYTQGCAVRAEFGAERDGYVAGRLYLCLPDEEDSWIAGSFDVPVRKQ
jgi:hypothetical protein